MPTPLTKDLLTGVTQETVNKLIRGNVLTLESLAATPISQVVELTGLGKETSEKVVKLAIAGTPGFQKLSERKRSSKFISTGSKALDALIGGGVETGSITEFAGGYGCHSEDTQVVTHHGFRNWRDVKIGDFILGERDGRVIETQVEEVYQYLYDGYMIHFKTLRMDLLVTPNHDVYFAPLGKGTLKMRADHVMSNCSWGYIPLTYIPKIPRITDFDVIPYIQKPVLDYPQKSHPRSNNHVFPIEPFLELIGFYISDGSALKCHHSIYPVFNHEKNQPRLFELIREIGLEYSIYEDRKIIIFNSNLGRYLLRCGEHAPEKHIPEELFNYNLESLFNGLMLCDANKAKTTYYTTSKKLAEQFTVLCVGLEKQASLRIYPPSTSILKDGRKIIGRYPSYSITISYNPKGYLEPRTPPLPFPYKGTVWCFKTSTGNFFTTRGRNIILSGNSGKSQLVCTLSVIAQLPESQGGINGKVAIIDTEGGIREDRVRQIIKARGLSDVLLADINVATALNTEQMEQRITELPALCNEGVRLVAVDSMAGNFRNEFIGRETLSTRQQKLGMMLGSLFRLAQAYEVAIVATNQMVAIPNAPTPYSPQEKPSLGNIMGHASTQRLQLRRAMDNKRIAKLIDSINMPPGEARFLITEKGITDVPEDIPEAKKKEEKKDG